jgi:hypothetical protein
MRKAALLRSFEVTKSTARWRTVANHGGIDLASYGWRGSIGTPNFLDKYGRGNMKS